MEAMVDQKVLADKVKEVLDWAVNRTYLVKERIHPGDRSIVLNVPAISWEAEEQSGVKVEANTIQKIVQKKRGGLEKRGPQDRAGHPSPDRDPAWHCREKSLMMLLLQDRT